MVDQVKCHSTTGCDYSSLIHRFPPRVIRCRKSYERTQRQIELFGASSRELNFDEGEYLALLRLLVKRYEGPEEKPRAVEYLKQLLEEHKLRIKDLSRILGKSIPLCSMILNGKRAITQQHAIRLGEYFGRGPEVFLV